MKQLLVSTGGGAKQQDTAQESTLTVDRDFDVEARSHLPLQIITDHLSLSIKRFFCSKCVVQLQLVPSFCALTQKRMRANCSQLKMDEKRERETFRLCVVNSDANQRQQQQQSPKIARKYQSKHQTVLKRQDFSHTLHNSLLLIVKLIN